MSDRAILLGVSEYLIERLSDWNVNNCKGMPDGQPDPMMGDKFAAVHITQIQSVINQDHQWLEELWGFGVTLTMRIKAIPYDRLTPQIYITQMTGFSPILKRIKLVLHNRHSLVNKINSYLETDDAEINALIESQCFLGPAFFINRSAKLRFHDDEWFHGYREDKPINEGYVGVSMMLNFGNLRLQTSLADDTCPVE